MNITNLNELNDSVNTSLLNIARQLAAISLNKNDQYHYNLLNDIADNKKMLAMLLGLNSQRYRVETNFPVAVQSNDHLHPWGTKNDNTRSPRLVKKCEGIFLNKKINYLDLGCSGGGLVLDFLLAGHNGFGLEGSNYSEINQRAEWKTIPNALKTADISKPFTIFDLQSNTTAIFDVITMWEVLEHIHERDIPTLLANLKKHMNAESIFIGSVALGDDIVDGISYHPTVKPKKWWHDLFVKCGFDVYEYELISFYDHCRGTGNGPLDGNYKNSPEMGFHVTLKVSQTK